MPSFEHTFTASAEGVVALGGCAADVAALDDSALLAAQGLVDIHRRLTDTSAAWIAAEIAHRSRHELGYSGLAQQKGFRSPEALIQSVTKIGAVEAAKLVAVGTLLAENEADALLIAGRAGTDSPESRDSIIDGASDASDAADSSNGSGPDAGDWADPPELSWRAPIGDSVSGGALSLEAADILRKVFRSIDSRVDASAIREAVELLIADASVINVDQLYRRARQARDRLDADGIREREAERHEARYLKLWQQADGMYRGSWQLDPENGRIVAAAFENILSPRRGGPRFVTAEEKARADALVADERTTIQIAADALVDIVRVAVDADPGTLFGRRHTAVRIIVTEESLRTRRGHGVIEGHTDPVSMETVERYMCNSGGIPIGFDDDGQCLNVGRTKRLFTEKQRIGLAVRDGGCRINGCDRPPSMCEAHHIDQWHRDTGETNVADGILLCRWHHMLLHNNHWDIIRDGADYWLQPPSSAGDQNLILLPTKNPLLETSHLRQRAS